MASHRKLSHKPIHPVAEESIQVARTPTLRLYMHLARLGAYFTKPTDAIRGCFPQPQNQNAHIGSLRDEGADETVRPANASAMRSSELHEHEWSKFLIHRERGP